jgi:cbb3-type cytochrome oxidase subunit 3
MTAFGIASIIVFALCCTGLILHYYVMKRRTRLDNALTALEILREGETLEDSEKSDFTTANKEYEAALADYKACISRFPWNVMVKILHLPHEK